jgi:hypothetical protein
MTMNARHGTDGLGPLEALVDEEGQDEILGTQPGLLEKAAHSLVLAQAAKAMGWERHGGSLRLNERAPV